MGFLRYVPLGLLPVLYVIMIFAFTGFFVPWSRSTLSNSDAVISFSVYLDKTCIHITIDDVSSEACYLPPAIKGYSADEDNIKFDSRAGEFTAMEVFYCFLFIMMLLVTLLESTSLFAKNPCFAIPRFVEKVYTKISGILSFLPEFSSRFILLLLSVLYHAIFAVIFFITFVIACYAVDNSKLKVINNTYNASLQTLPGEGFFFFFFPTVLFCVCTVALTVLRFFLRDDDMEFVPSEPSREPTSATTDF